MLGFDQLRKIGEKLSKALDIHISLALNHYVTEIGKHFGCDVISYIGPIFPAAIPRYREGVEFLHAQSAQKNHQFPERLVIVLATPGGSVEAVEKMVDITRHHYKEVFFVIPDVAMSAGTIWSMSGDKIWMDYASSLGPIDPQVESKNRGMFVPALGYIEKVEEFIKKGQAGTLSVVEAALLKGLDLAELHRFEQARDLSIDLLKKWLVKYKFKNWTAHRTNNPGAVVTVQEKEQRASQIAAELNKTTKWFSHGRMISKETLEKDLRLEIDDYSSLTPLRENVKTYHGLLVDEVERQGAPLLIHHLRS